MKRSDIIRTGAAMLFIAALAVGCRRSGDSGGVVEVRKGKIEVWTVTDG